MTSLCTYIALATIMYFCSSLNEGGVKSGSPISLCEYSAFFVVLYSIEPHLGMTCSRRCCTAGDFHQAVH